MFWPYAISCAPHWSSKRGEIGLSQSRAERRWRGILTVLTWELHKLPTKQSTPLKLDKNTERSIRCWSGCSDQNTHTHTKKSIYMLNNMCAFYIPVLKLIIGAALTKMLWSMRSQPEGCLESDGGKKPWCNVWAWKKDTLLSQQLLHH